MAVIHHYERLIFVRQIADPLQIRNDTVHGKNAVRSNQFDSCTRFIRCFQLFPQVFHIVVLIPESFCLAQTHTVDDTGVVQLITDHCVIRCQNGLKQPAVSIKTR